MFYSGERRHFPCKLLKIKHSCTGKTLVPEVHVTALPWRSVRRGERKGLKPRLDP